MSTAISVFSERDTGQSLPIYPMPVRRRLHRLAEARRQEGVTRRTLAGRMGVSPEDVSQQEKDIDLPLSTLYAWQQALDIPVAELLVEGDTTLSTPVLQRARLLRMMKTVMTIVTRSKQSSIRRLARFLAEQLSELMPELKEASPWPSVGKRRTRHELGQAAVRQFAAALAIELDRDSA